MKVYNLLSAPISVPVPESLIANWHVELYHDAKRIEQYRTGVYKASTTKYNGVCVHEASTSNGQATISACCGSTLIDCDHDTVRDWWNRFECKYYSVPLSKFVDNSAKYSRGISVYINNTGQVPEKGEDSVDIYDTFTFDDGEKMTFQFRKAV